MLPTLTKLRRCVAEHWDGTQEELARAVMISPTLLKDFCLGQRPLHPAHHVLNLAKVLNVKPAELIGVCEIEQV